MMKKRTVRIISCVIAGILVVAMLVSMLASSLTGEETDPGAMADWAYQQGYCAPGNGSYLSIVEGTASAIGLKAEAYEADSADALVQANWPIPVHPFWLR